MATQQQLIEQLIKHLCDQGTFDFDKLVENVSSKSGDYDWIKRLGKITDGLSKSVVPIQFTSHAHDCPDSPDGKCHYFTEENELGVRFVKLDNEKIWYAPATHQHKYETSDRCLFCGEPDERK